MAAEQSRNTEYMRRHREKNLEKYNSYHRKYYSQRSDVINARNRERRQKKEWGEPDG